MNDRGAGWRNSSAGDDYSRWEAGSTPQDQQAFAAQRYYGDERRGYEGWNRGRYGRAGDEWRADRELGWRERAPGFREPIYGRSGNDYMTARAGLNRERGFGTGPGRRDQGPMPLSGWGDARDSGSESRPEYGYPRGIGEGFGFYGRPGIGSQAFDQGWAQGPHAGRGPRGYQRSDERIRDEVCERLTQHGWLDAGEMEVEVQSGEVILRGEVDSRSQKRLAEDIVQDVAGVKDVHNRLRVRANAQATPPQSGQHADVEQQTAGSSNHHRLSANR